MSDLNNGLLTRIETLEKQNRRMRWAGGLLATLAVTGMGMSMAGPRVCKTVWGERFVLKDSSLRERMVLDAYSTRTPSLAFKDIEGKKIAELSMGSGGALAMQIFKNGKKTRAHFELVPDGDSDGDSDAR